jgi:hypothetical protein
LHTSAQPSSLVLIEPVPSENATGIDQHATAQVEQQPSDSCAIPLP